MYETVLSSQFQGSYGDDLRECHVVREFLKHFRMISNGDETAGCSL